MAADDPEFRNTSPSGRREPLVGTFRLLKYSNVDDGQAIPSDTSENLRVRSVYGLLFVERIGGRTATFACFGMAPSAWRIRFAVGWAAWPCRGFGILGHLVSSMCRFHSSPESPRKRIPGQGRCVPCHDGRRSRAPDIISG